MSVLLYLVPAALSLGLLGLVAFLWSLGSGQYDDIEGAAVRVLSDDDLAGETREDRRATVHERPDRNALTGEPRT